MNEESRDVKIARLEENVDRFCSVATEAKGKLDNLCEKCLVRKIVYGVVGLIGTAVVVAILALIIKGGIIK